MNIFFLVSIHRDWKFEHPEHGHSNVSSPIPIKLDQAPSYSMRQARVGERSLFSKEVLYSLVITNVLSILLGAGLGWVAWVNIVIIDDSNSCTLFLASGCRNAASYLLVCQLSKQPLPSPPPTSAWETLYMKQKSVNLIKLNFLLSPLERRRNCEMNQAQDATICIVLMDDAEAHNLITFFTFIRD